MQADYHIHTYLCGHAKGMPDEYVATARELGLEEICFTDHAPDPDGYDPANRMSMEQFEEYRGMVESARESSNITVLYGIEADYYEDCEKFLGPWLKENDFDLVIGSVHYLAEWGFDNPAERKVWDAVDVDNTWKDYFELMGRLADSGLYDIIGHLDLPKKFKYRPDDNTLKKIAAPALDSIAAAGMSIELNTSGLRRPVEEIYPSLILLRIARERDIPITFGSDSHAPEHVGFAFEEALELARAAGYTQCARYRARKKELIALPGSD